MVRIVTEAERPLALRNAATAVAYSLWLTENGFEDSDASAWRFAAELKVTPTDPPAPPPGATAQRRRIRLWVPLAGTLALVALILGAVAFATSTAHHWNKVDHVEVYRIIDVPDGTWHVTNEPKDVCFVGQNYADCADAYTSEWNYACSHRAHDSSSRELCDNYYDVIQKMKTSEAKSPGGEVSDVTGSGKLSIRENTTTKKVVDVPEKSHEAVCYLGFIGECPSEDEANEGA